jgi:hypothetical protein
LTQTKAEPPLIQRAAADIRSFGIGMPYARRPSFWGDRYEIWQKNLMWRCDWTKLRIGDLRWYLLTVNDFFSRLIIANDILPTVNDAPQAHNLSCTCGANPPM